MNAIAFFGVFCCYGYALILMMEWLVHALPGSSLNPFRRFFFYLGYPFLKIGRGWFSFQWNGFDSRGLGLSLALWMMGRFGVPWLVLWGFTLKG
jgi:hypothetical protein